MGVEKQLKVIGSKKGRLALYIVIFIKKAVILYFYIRISVGLN